MGGSLVSFSGVRCSRLVRLARSRGYDADLSVIEVPVPRLDAYSFAVAAPGEATGPIDLQVPDLAQIRSLSPGTRAAGTPARPPTPKPLPDVRLIFGGTLCVAEAQDEDWQVVAHPMLVTRVERQRRGQNGSAVLVVTLADERFLWGRGFVRRWSFNRTRADGLVARDSVGPGGLPWRLDEVARQLVGALPRGKKLSAFPADWSGKPVGHVEFAPFAPAVSCLAELERERGIEAPCLRWDGTVALHRLGEGRVGYAPKGEGSNALELPNAVRLSKQGTGAGHTAQATYPDDFVLVRGKERIQTVAVDGWDPVLVVRARRRDPAGPQASGVQDLELAQGDEVGAPRVLRLNDETVKALSKGKLNLEGLRRWIVQPPAYQDAVGLPEDVARLFRDQAGRLYRCPRVEEEDDGAGGRIPAQNAGLLPLLPRAETVDGRRAPIMVQTYRFKARHKVLGAPGDREERQFGESQQRVRELRERAQELARVQKKPNPFVDPWSSRNHLTGSGTLSVQELLGDALLNNPNTPPIEDLQRAIDAARVVEALREVDAGLAGEYEAELQAQAEAISALNGTPEKELFQLGKEAARFEAQLRDSASSSLSLIGGESADITDLGSSLSLFLSDNDTAKRARDVFRKSLADNMRALGRQGDDRVTRAKAGVTARSLLKPDTGPIFVVNLPRTEDVGASVYSPELGIVETSTLAGWLDPEGVPSPADSRFLFKPVRVIFGAVVRPGFGVTDVDDTKTRTRALVPGDALGGDAIPFHRAFRRNAAGGADAVSLDEVPPGEGTVVPLDRHELIPLVGEGNTGELELLARELAEERCRVRPLIESETWVAGRPWPVQCDGVVQSVEIVQRASGNGFETRVVIGAGIKDPDPMRTRTRPAPQKDRGDGSSREGSAWSAGAAPAAPAAPAADPGRSRTR